MKKYILVFLLGGIIFSSISLVGASILYKSKEVSYINSKSEVSNVQDAIDDLYQKNNIGDAEAADILTGKSAMVNGSEVIGTMPNNGALESTINPGASFTIPAGFTTGGVINAIENSDTYTFASGSTGGKVDLGTTNTYRYVDAANVYAKGKADGASSNINLSFKYAQSTGGSSFSVIPNHYYICINNGTSGWIVTGGGTMVSSYQFVNASNVNIGYYYAYLVKATSSKISFNTNVALFHVGG